MDNVVIFIRSYAKDAPWLEYCLRSIKKFAYGFKYVFITVPMRDMDLFAPLAARHGCQLHMQHEPEGKGMCAAMCKLCHADELCQDAEHFLFMDSDCFCMEYIRPEDYFVRGKPLLLGESFLKLEKQDDELSRSRANYWRPAVRNALGFNPPYETMVRQPNIYHRAIFAPFRAAVEAHTGKRFDDYVMSGRNEFPWEFSEFPALGAFALDRFRDAYHFVDVDNEGGKREKTMVGGSVLKNKMLVEWSHGGVTPDIKKELEAYLG